ncbi:MAG: penicillin-binding protein 2 [Ruminococcaceae bacterium]|nr:penicillin-binding protein 2 [Oscillospiraceae bacterium]
MYIYYKRSRYLYFITVFIFTLLTLKLIYICTFEKDAFEKAIAVQSTKTVSIETKRKNIYDRNMIPLTNLDKKTVYLTSDLKHGKKISSVKITMPQRYPSYPLVTHMVGYSSYDSVGLSGIEKKFDSYLKTNDNYVLNCRVDGVGRLWEKERKSVSFPKEEIGGIKLTIDSHIQSAVQKVMEKHIKSGAAIVLDVETFDIVASVSLPDFDRENIEKYLESENSELLNKCLSGFNAGSVFKTVTAICAIENSSREIYYPYNCTGSFKTPDGKEFLCHKKEGHGVLDFKNAFASSCNCYFYNLGLSLGADKICETAKKLMFGENVLGFSDEEAKGNIPDFETFTYGDSANVSIGQGEIMVTPIQCAVLMGTIASGGIMKKVNVADSEVDVFGNEISSLRNEGEIQVISRDCAKIISDMMRLCVTDGTGKTIGNSNFSIAGKTGSAETGWKNSDGTFKVHGWFAGFFPYESPKYAMVIFSDDGKSGAGSCVLPFWEICEKINEFYPIKQ